MGQFKEVYKQIISQHIGQKIDQLTNFLTEVYPLQHQYFNRFKIINTLVKKEENNLEIIDIDYANNGLTEEQRKILDIFIYKKENRMLIWTMIVDKFSKEEYLKTVKDIINFFKRLYTLKGNNQNKEQWLDNFLISINNYSYFQKYNLFNQFNEYLDSKDKTETFNITLVLICICYFILKLNYDIDKVLKNQFKE